MQRHTGSFIIEDVVAYKQQMLNWADRFGICCFLDSHGYTDAYGAYDCLLAAGAVNIFSPAGVVFPQLRAFTGQCGDWLFGHICYDIKNEIESLGSNHPDNISFPDIFFFQPQVVITLSGSRLSIACLNDDPQDIYRQMQSTSTTTAGDKPSAIALQPRITRQEYITTVQQLQQHILRGDCYEINFCPEFFADNTGIHPLTVYKSLSRISPAPFAAYYKLNGKYVIGASPERYIQKKGRQLISQPIKGTAKRDVFNRQNDELLKQWLFNSAKDRTENVMITDLVRNDLSRICSEGSVQVKELFGIYTYPQVHQMVTTVAGDVPPGINIADVLQATFPMGSMTGAPKRRVMQLIEQYESTRRGLYSGSIGYITPDNDFDFNVVIRSILYNQPEQYISCSAGSAITFYSDAAEEYEECLLKAKAMQEALNSEQ